MTIFNRYPFNGSKTIGSINFNTGTLRMNDAQVFRDFNYDGYSSEIFDESFWQVVSPPTPWILLTYNGSSWVNAGA